METIMGDNDSNSSPLSCDKPRYQVKVKCQWFYFKIPISIFSNWLSSFFLLNKFILIKMLSGNTIDESATQECTLLEALGLGFVSKHPLCPLQRFRCNTSHLGKGTTYFPLTESKTETYFLMLSLGSGFSRARISLSCHISWLKLIPFHPWPRKNPPNSQTVC